jgi:eukaryotic-like serine/threonine-protein kinase
MAAGWERLLGLFEGALERSTSDRAAFLDEHTKDDPLLRREIESLLEAHEKAGPFLSATAPGPSIELLPVSPEPVRSAPGDTRLGAGTSLGAFTVLEPIGAGGMGEVYRARDTRLDRLVAIKVLSSEYATAPGGRGRFEREARAISRLSHPRICTVHDVGVASLTGSDVPFLVMELLDGETLAARLARGPLSIEQSLAFAIDIADALVAAHSHGIVHRDLKPANVMVTSTGVKLLDFGLAQLRAPHAAGASAAAVSSIPGLTGGLVLGTLPYSSPEQLRGEPVDGRTDIFAFGALLYEMLTGSRPFEADSQAGLIAAVLEHDAPPVSSRQPLAQANLDRIVQKCLAKHPDDRWQTARDLKSELVWVRDGGDQRRSSPTPVSNAGRDRRRHVWLMAIPTLVALLLAMLLWRSGNTREPTVQTAPSRAVTRLALNFPSGVTLDIPVNATSFAIAPDGSRIAFVGVRDSRKSLFVHTLQSGQTVSIPDTADATNPMFSPDSQWVAYAGAKAVFKVPAAGGPRQVMLEGALRRMRWFPDGRIVSAAANGSLQQVDTGPRQLTKLRDGEEFHHTPISMPDGSILFTVLRAGYLSSLNSVALLPPGGSEARDVVPNATSPHLMGPETIVFAQGASLMAAAFDSAAVRLKGEPRALDVRVQTTLYSVAPMYAVANNGTLVYAEPAAGRRLVWIDRQGVELPFPAESRMYSHLRLSPDGTRVAAHDADGDRDLWVLPVDGGLDQRLTSGPARDAMPVWSRDGSEIFFTTGERNIYRVPADRSRGPEPVLQLQHPDRIHPLAITPDGGRLLTHWDRMPKEIDLRVVELGPTPKLTPLVGDSRTEHDGRLSPDGKWLAYESSESTVRPASQIAVRRFDDIRAEQHIVGAGHLPIWSSDGKEIFYLTAEGTVMSVRVQTTPSFRRSTPVPVVTPSLTFGDVGTGPTYDVSPDGRRFLFIKAPELGIRSLTVVLNWDVEVQATLAGKRP